MKTLHVICAFFIATVSIVTGFYTGSKLEAVLIGILLLLVDLAVLILIHVSRKPDSRDAVANRYKSLQRNRNDLVKLLARSKHSEVLSFFDDLSRDQLKLTDLSDVDKVIKVLFLDLDDVREIHATSRGELDEWRDESNWWIRQYLRIHKDAAKRGVRLVRTFILETESERASAEDVVRENTKLRVLVKIALKNFIRTQDLNLASNCLIFYDRRREPIYCLQVAHDEQGHFTTARLYRRPENMRPIVESVRRIDEVAQRHEEI